MRLTKEIGRICYFEIVDRSREGHITVDKIVLSDSKQPPSLELRPRMKLVESLLRAPDVTTLESLAEAYEKLFSSAWARTGTLDNDARRLVSALAPTRKLEDLACLLSGAGTGEDWPNFRIADQSWRGRSRNPHLPWSRAMRIPATFAFIFEETTRPWARKSPGVSCK